MRCCEELGLLLQRLGVLLALCTRAIAMYACWRCDVLVELS